MNAGFLCKKLLIFYYQRTLQGSLNWRCIQGKLTIANYISEKLRRNMLFSIQQHKRVLLEITGELTTSRVQSVLKNAALVRKTAESKVST